MSGLSFVLVTDTLPRVAGVLQALRAQTVADQVELVLIVPKELEVPPEVGVGIGSLVIGRVANPAELPIGRAAGVRASTQPVIAIGETHAFPDPGYAEAILAAHAGPWASVGPEMANANPGGLSWAAMLMDYGAWIAPPAREEVADLPVHNGSFKREALLAYGDGLVAAFERDAQINGELVAGGGRLLIEPAARVRHLNVSAPRPWMAERFQAARSFAGGRRVGWSRPKALAYAAASPLIPFVRLRRILPVARRAQVGWWALACLAFGLVLSAAGECAGYLAGGEQATCWRWATELDKGKHIRARDREIAVRG